jgi:sensor histidine kinase YesM
LKTTSFTQRDNLIALSTLPFYYLLFGYMLIGPLYFQRIDTFLLTTAVVAVIWTPVFFLHALPAIYLRDKLPEVRQTWLRMSLALLVHMVLTSVSIYGFFYGFKWVHFPNYTFSATHLHITLLIGLVGNILVNVVHEGVYTFERWAQTLGETEKLKKANLQSQLEGLKQQVNPHFLFNSLNSLSSLIDEDPDRAEAFIDELSSVYRYLLQSNMAELTTLATELAFIRSYFHLQQTRYGSGLNLTINVDENCLDDQLPPLTLQLLVENAIKHNIVGADQPLHIEIRTDLTGRLVVSNNLQRKVSRVLSNGVGLANIITKYQLLTKSAVRVDEQSEKFVVTLPLISQPVVPSRA